MANQLLNTSRNWHRKIASILFIFFFIIGLTGLMLGWKSLFTKTIFDNKTIKPEASYRKWLPLDSLEKLATASLNKMTSKHYKEAENIQLKPSKGLITFTYKDYYSIQVNGATGATMHVEQKLGTWIQDIHDGAIIDGMFGGKTGVSKSTYTTIMALSLLFLTVSGFYLWYKPKQLKRTKKLYEIRTKNLAMPDADMVSVSK